MIPTVRAMESEGMPYCGFLYAGLMIKDGAAKALEFNCRLGDPEAQPLLFRMNSDIVPLMTAAVAGDLAGRTIEWADEHAVCVVMASGGYPGAYAKGAPISGIDEAERIQGVKVFQAGTASKDGAIVSAGGRVLGVTAKAIGIADSIAKAYEAVSKISWTDVHYRKDIARKALNRPSS
jgi:phosphoribosylamine--glycine ligase